MDHDILASRFEANRARLRAVAYRMLGSLSEAEDAVQEAWLRLGRSDSATIDNLEGWLTTVVGRVCLDMLRARKSRPEEPGGVRLPDAIVTDDSAAAEDEMLLADSIGLALLVVLETLDPAERLAFVLHDMFGMPFDEIATIVGRSSAAARQLASRARRRIQGTTAAGPTDRARQREAVDAFLAAARDGNFEGLVAVLDPDAVLRAETAAGATVVRGAQQIAKQATAFSQGGITRIPVLINGEPGILARRRDGRAISVLAFTVVDRKIVEIHIYADPARLKRMGVA
jgi:RNA polymerase sigma-70 factor (ECF subfamily)